MMFRNKGVMKFYSGRKFSNGIIRNNYTLLELSDRDLNRYLSPIGLRSAGKKRLQNHFVETCLNFKPDLILLGHCELIENKSLFKIREVFPNIKIAHWFLDALWIQRNIERLQARMPAVDAIFLTTDKAVAHLKNENNAIIEYIPNPTDRSEDCLNNANINNFEHDLLFCGLGRQDDYRSDFVKELDNGLPDNIRFKKIGFYGDPPVWGESYKAILAKSKMALNLNGEEGWPFYSSDRIAQLMGNGILTFLWNKGDMKKIIPDNNAVYFDRIEELHEKIMYFHTHDDERKKIASLGYEYYTHQFSSERIIKYIVEITFKLPFSQNYIWKN